MPKDCIACDEHDGEPGAEASPSTEPTSAEHERLDQDRRARRGGRVAPSARSVPISRIRCSTVMLNELRIRNAPTNSAMPEKK